MDARQSDRRPMLRPMFHIEIGHQSEHADGKQNRRCERSQESQARPKTDDEVNGDNGPYGESGRFVKISDGAMVEPEPAQCHSRGMQAKSQKENRVIYVIIPPKPF